jgi:hypothetical protein
MEQAIVLFTVRSNPCRWEDNIKLDLRVNAVLQTGLMS